MVPVVKDRRRLRSLLAVFLLAGCCQAQKLLFDTQARAGGLEFAQDLDHPDFYYYIPKNLYLTRNEAGIPSFYFEKLNDYRYSANGTAVPATVGLLRFEVELGVDSILLDSCWKALKTRNPEAVCMGGVRFESSTLKLVSSVLDSSLCLTTHISPSDNALSRPGDRVRVTVVLNGLGTNILWKSYETTVPDMSVLLNASFAGWTTHYSTNNLVLVHRICRFDANIGRPKDCDTCFIAPVSNTLAYEPEYRWRDIRLIPGADANPTQVRVMLRKTHADGQVSLDEMTFPETPGFHTGRKRLGYPGRPGDEKDAAWLKYEYRIIKKDDNGAQRDSGWTDSEWPVIFLD